nr:hypothetical protein Iba_scaffold4346CG0420 [Ipomoea batatas]
MHRRNREERRHPGHRAGATAAAFALECRRKLRHTTARSRCRCVVPEEDAPSSFAERGKMTGKPVPLRRSVTAERRGRHRYLQPLLLCFDIRREEQRGGCSSILAAGGNIRRSCLAAATASPSPPPSTCFNEETALVDGNQGQSLPLLGLPSDGGLSSFCHQRGEGKKDRRC